MKYIFFLAFIFLGTVQLTAQDANYEVELNTIQIPELGGLQSYVIGSYNNEWVILGGRLDGLHQRQPFASFNEEGNNQDIIIVNLTSKTVWRKSIETLPINIKEQLSSTNMQFCQVEEDLIITGGYGFSPSENDHITYPYLTVINLPTIINQVKSNALETDAFKQIFNEMFRVTGGRLAQMNDVFYLVGGHKFMGRYNPIGPDHGPGFEQYYTNEIRKFELNISDQLQLNVLPAVHDARHFRKRDYNLVPFISNGNAGLMAFSGVFQENIDLPFLYPVQIGEDYYLALEEFKQYYNHYHCATLPIYNESNEEMNTLFFGGIAQFYMDGELLVQDNDVPFVNSIASIVMDKDGGLNETLLDTEMPGYLGAGSEFIFANDDKLYREGILDGDQMDNDFQTVGYIYGGIRSSLPNVFWINTGEESEASSTVYEVKLKRKSPSALNDEAINENNLFFYPNPSQNFIKMSIKIDVVVDLDIEVLNLQGDLIHTQKIPKESLHKGTNLLVLDDVNIGYGAFIYKVGIGNRFISRKVVWSE